MSSLALAGGIPHVDVRNGQRSGTGSGLESFRSRSPTGGWGILFRMLQNDPDFDYALSKDTISKVRVIGNSWGKLTAKVHAANAIRRPTRFLARRGR